MHCSSVDWLQSRTFHGSYIALVIAGPVHQDDQAPGQDGQEGGRPHHAGSKGTIMS